MQMCIRDRFYRLIIPGGIVFPVHPFQGGVAARLEGQVKVWAQVGQDGGPAAELLGNSPRLQRAQPDAEVRYRPADSIHQVNQGRAVFQVLDVYKRQSFTRRADTGRGDSMV